MARINEKLIAEKWARFKESLGDEIITDAYSEEEVNELIRDAGGDPEGIDRRSIQQARELWNQWQQSSVEKEANDIGNESKETNTRAQISTPQRYPIFHGQNVIAFNAGHYMNFGAVTQVKRDWDKASQRERSVRAILEVAGAIQRDYDYGLPCKLHSDTHIDIGKICESEEYLEKIVSALNEMIENEPFDTIVSNGWPLATIARRLMLRHTRRPPYIRHVKVEGYNPPNVLDQINPGARVILLLDVVVTGTQALRVTEELHRQKAKSVKAVAIVDVDVARKHVAVESLCRVAMDLAEPSECDRCDHLPSVEFNPIAGKMTKKKPPRSPSEFLDQDSTAREFWDFVNTAGAFEHHRIDGKRHYFGFVDTARLLQLPVTREPIVEKLCQQINERWGIPDIVLVPRRFRAELTGRCIVSWFNKFLGISRVQLKYARSKRGHFIIDGVKQLSGMRVLVADAAAGHGDTLDELTLLSLRANAASVAAAVLLSRLSEGCEKAFDERLTGRFVKLYSMPVRPVTVRNNSRMNCPVCQRRQNLRVTIAELPEGAVRDAARKLMLVRGFRKKAAAMHSRQLALFSRNPLATCRRSVASGIALHALHAAMNDGMAPLSLPEIASHEYPVENKAALIADLPAETLAWSKPELLEQLKECLKTGADKPVWKEIVEFMNRSRSTDWIDCLDDAIRSAESNNQWMDSKFWAWMMQVAYRLLRDRPEIGAWMESTFQALSQNYDREPIHNGLQGMLTVITNAQKPVVTESEDFETPLK
jgi:Orotate phosphoribosyltransferase